MVFHMPNSRNVRQSVFCHYARLYTNAITASGSAAMSAASATRYRSNLAYALD